MSLSPQKSPTGFTSARTYKPILDIPQKGDYKSGPLSSRNASEKSFSLVRDLAEIKERRKLMESNAQLLLNRLQVLSQEEQKVKRNVFDINKRSQELLSHRLQREKQKSKEEDDVKKHVKDKASELEQIRHAVGEARAKAQSDAKKVQSLIQDRRKKEAEAIRQQRIENQEKIIQAKFEHADLLKGKVQKVKQQEEISSIKASQYHQVKADIMREEREKLIREEEERILQKERELERLNRREDALLELLNKADSKETRAITEYDEISKLAVDDLASKYGFYLKTETSRLGHTKTLSLSGSSMMNGTGINQSKSATLQLSPFKPMGKKKASHLSP